MYRAPTSGQGALSRKAPEHVRRRCLLVVRAHAPQPAFNEYGYSPLARYPVGYQVIVSPKRSETAYTAANSIGATLCASRKITVPLLSHEPRNPSETVV